jgi:hypothetical protein
MLKYPGHEVLRSSIISLLRFALLVVSLNESALAVLLNDDEGFCDEDSKELVSFAAKKEVLQDR